MEQPESGTGQAELSQASTMPEGASFTNPPLSDGLQALRVELNPTADFSLDLQANLGEPEQLMVVLYRMAVENGWATIAKFSKMAIEEHELLNRPKSA